MSTLSDCDLPCRLTQTIMECAGTYLWELANEWGLRWLGRQKGKGVWGQAHLQGTQGCKSLWGRKFSYLRTQQSSSAVTKQPVLCSAVKTVFLHFLPQEQGLSEHMIIGVCGTFHKPLISHLCILLTHFPLCCDIQITHDSTVLI